MLFLHIERDYFWDAPCNILLIKKTVKVNRGDHTDSCTKVSWAMRVLKHVVRVDSTASPLFTNFVLLELLLSLALVLPQKPRSELFASYDLFLETIPAINQGQC